MKKKMSILIITMFALVSIFGFSNSVALAADPQPAVTSCSNQTKFFGLPAWYEYLTVVPDNVGGCEVVTDDANGNVGILVLLAVLDILFRLGAIVAVVFVVYGGFMFVTSQGEPAKIVSARKAILNAIVGLIIVILASQIVKFIASYLSKSV